MNIRCTEREKKKLFRFPEWNLDGTSVCRFLTPHQRRTNYSLSRLLLLPANWNWRNDGRVWEGRGERKLGQIFLSCRVSTSRSIKLVAESCPFSWDTVVPHTCRAHIRVRCNVRATTSAVRLHRRLNWNE